MRLFDCNTAPSPRRVRIFAAEKNLELELVPVDLGSGEQFSADFRAVNPDCVVPALELDDGTCISEVVAICQYLEEFQPEPTLFGSRQLSVLPLRCGTRRQSNRVCGQWRMPTAITREDSRATHCPVPTNTRKYRSSRSAARVGFCLSSKNWMRD